MLSPLAVSSRVQNPVYDFREESLCEPLVTVFDAPSFLSQDPDYLPPARGLSGR